MEELSSTCAFALAEGGYGISVHKHSECIYKACSCTCHQPSLFEWLKSLLSK